MRIIISPAKKMNIDTDNLPWLSLPEFISNTAEILSSMQNLDYNALKNLWKCNDQLAQLNYERINNMDLYAMLSPAILAYEGIQYQYMGPGVFTTQELDYIQNHLRIISGFYGILRPFDGVSPYRLEMQAKLQVGKSKDLYAYWGNKLANKLSSESDCIINLASKEYSLAVSKHLSQSTNFITCVFAEEQNGKLIEKGTMCKMARGEMVRYMAENQILNAEKIKNFDRLNFIYSPQHSKSDKYVFIKENQAK